MTQKMPRASQTEQFLSQDQMRMRDSIMCFVEKEYELAVNRNEDVDFKKHFRTLLDRAVIRLNSSRYKSYFQVPEIVRSAIANKYAMIRIARVEEEKLRRFHKHQLALNFEPIEDDNPPF